MLPVRSAIFKQNTGGLVVRWVTTGEYPLLYVFAFLHIDALLTVAERSSQDIRRKAFTFFASINLAFIVCS
jgi:hypothetical protein